MATGIATPEEIERRIEEADLARSAQRASAARAVGDLAQRHAALVEQLDDVERELGEVLAGASAVIEVDELARFTDVPAADLTRWLTNRKPTRGKRRKAAARDPAMASTARREPPVPRPASAGATANPPQPARPRDGAAGASDRPASAT